MGTRELSNQRASVFSDERIPKEVERAEHPESTISRERSESRASG